MYMGCFHQLMVAHVVVERQTYIHTHTLSEKQFQETRRAPTARMACAWFKKLFDK